MRKGEVRRAERRIMKEAESEAPLSNLNERDISIDRKRLGDLIEAATTSPLLHLEDRALSSIKSLVRASDSNVHAAFDFLLDRLKKNHSQVRYLAVLLIDEFFTRSKLFRSLLVLQFETFILLSVGFRADYPLPPPDDRATLLRKKSIELVEKWNDMFGQHYKSIRLGHDYLKNTLRLEFPNVREVATLASQQRREREERTQELLKRKFETLRDQFPNLKADIQSTLDEIDQCLNILVPPAATSQDAAQGTQTDGDNGDEDDEFETFGVESLRHLRDVVEEQDILPQESTDNSAVFDTLRDLYKLLMTRHLVNSHEWLTTLMRVDPEENRQSRDSLLREIIDLRNHLLQIRAKCEGLGIQTFEGSGAADAGEEFNDEIWEQGDILSDAGVVPQSSPVESNRSAADVPSSSNSTAMESDETKRKSEKIEVVGIKQNLLKQAPVLPWGTFLDTWGSQSAVPANPRGMEYDNHWGKVDYDVMIPAEKIAEISVRASYYEAPKVEIRPCGAPLRNGGFCERRDLRKCPLHGPIRARDEQGNIIPEEVDLAQSSTGLQAENAKCEQLTGPGGDEADVETGVLTGSQSLDPVQVAEQAIGNVRKMDEQARAVARRHRSKRTREHNEACLREAATAQIRLGGFGEAPTGAFGGWDSVDSLAKKPRGGLTALLRKKPTAKDRLARRLLNGRVTEATVSQLARDQDAAYRESFPNQWTMK